MARDFYRFFATDKTAQNRANILSRLLLCDGGLEEPITIDAQTALEEHSM